MGINKKRPADLSIVKRLGGFLCCKITANFRYKQFFEEENAIFTPFPRFSAVIMLELLFTAYIIVSSTIWIATDINKKRLARFEHCFNRLGPILSLLTTDSNHK